MSEHCEQGRPSTTDAAGPPTSFVIVAMVDSQGRVSVRKAARALGWRPGVPVELTIADNVLRLSEAKTSSTECSGVTAVIDRRGRVQLPYGVRKLVGLAPGLAAVGLTTVDDRLVLVPAARLILAPGSNETG